MKEFFPSFPLCIYRGKKIAKLKSQIGKFFHRHFSYFLFYFSSAIKCIILLTYLNGASVWVLYFLLLLCICVARTQKEEGKFSYIFSICIVGILFSAEIIVEWKFFLLDNINIYLKWKFSESFCQFTESFIYNKSFSALFYN